MSSNKAGNDRDIYQEIGNAPERTHMKKNVSAIWGWKYVTCHFKISRAIRKSTCRKHCSLSFELRIRSLATNTDCYFDLSSNEFP